MEPLRVLMVLGSDFERPAEFSRSKNYEMSIPFKMNDVSLRKKITGFISTTIYDNDSKELQVNTWVRHVSLLRKPFFFHPFPQGLLFYALVDGDNIDRDDYGKSGVLGQIMTYEQFCSMMDLS